MEKMLIICMMLMYLQSILPGASSASFYSFGGGVMQSCGEAKQTFCRPVKGELGASPAMPGLQGCWKQMIMKKTRFLPRNMTWDSQTPSERWSHHVKIFFRLLSLLPLSLGGTNPPFRTLGRRKNITRISIQKSSNTLQNTYLLQRCSHKLWKKRLCTQKIQTPKN